MIPCYCTNMIGNKRNPFIAPKFLVVLHFYDNTLHILLVNVNYFTFYHSNDLFMSIINEDKPFQNVHTSIGGHLGFGHLMDTRGKIELGTISKIA